MLTARADPARLRLLPLVASHTDGEAGVGDRRQPFDLSQPTSSHHPGICHEAGLLQREKRGVRVHYRVGRTVPCRLGLVIGSHGR